jgi:hypothetical protein
MKQLKFYSILLCALLLLPLLSSCATERFDLLYEVAYNGITYCARGEDGQVKQIVVKEDGKAVWSKRVRTDRKMEKIDDTYGLSIQDLNFDGYDDILIATEADGDCVYYDCFLRDGEKKEYTRNDVLSGLCNVKADAKKQAILVFEQTLEARGDNAYVKTDKATKYFWQDGKLVPDMYVALSYYSDSDYKPYFYSVAYYDEELRHFGDSSDKWMTEEEYEKTDWSETVYYFK